jgi:peptide/nickel transport system permease protein
VTGARVVALAGARLATVVVSVMALTYLMLRGLRPDLFRGEDAVPVALPRFLEDVFLHLDFGRSSFGGREVSELIRQGLPADLALLGGGLAIGLLGGMALGMRCAARPRAASSRLIEAAALTGQCTPVYLTGLGVLLLFGSGIGVVDGLAVIPTNYVRPTEDPLRWLGAIVVPWLVLALPLAGMVVRAMRGSLRDVLGDDPIRLAHGKGLHPQTVMRRHAAPLAAAPVLGLASATTGLVVVNLVLIEQVFSVPGVFAGLRRALGVMDLPVLFGLVFVAAVYTAAISLLLDLTLARLDPRTRRR